MALVGHWHQVCGVSVVCFPSGLLTQKHHDSSLLAFVKIGGAVGCLAYVRDALRVVWLKKQC